MKPSELHELDDDQLIAAVRASNRRPPAEPDWAAMQTAIDAECDRVDTRRERSWFGLRWLVPASAALTAAAVLIMMQSTDSEPRATRPLVDGSQVAKANTEPTDDLEAGLPTIEALRNPLAMAESIGLYDLSAGELDDLSDLELDTVDLALAELDLIDDLVTADELFGLATEEDDDPNDDLMWPADYDVSLEDLTAEELELLDTSYEGPPGARAG